MWCPCSGYDITYWKLEGKSPGVLYIPSLWDGGERTRHLEEYCRREGRQFVHFHLSGRGESEGELNQVSMTDWLADCLSILKQVTGEGQVIVGCGVGGWLMFLTTLREPDMIHSLVGVATSPDIFERIWSKLSDQEKREVKRSGYYNLKVKDLETKMPLSAFQDASKYCILSMPGLEIINAPVKLVHGGKDMLTPPSVAMDILKRLSSSTTFNVIDDGDHDLLRAEDLAMIESAVDQCFNPEQGEDSDEEA